MPQVRMKKNKKVSRRDFLQATGAGFLIGLPGERLAPRL
jgi:hypothetical protein